MQKNCPEWPPKSQFLVSKCPLKGEIYYISTFVVLRKTDLGNTKFIFAFMLIYVKHNKKDPKIAIFGLKRAF